jgi:NAD-dependent SIR2 family protein deacetylase
MDDEPAPAGARLIMRAVGDAATLPPLIAAARPRHEGGKERAFAALLHTVETAKRLVVLTGAGCSTESGIPAYRDAHGNWCRTTPVMYRDFVQSASVRARYWARSAVGWRHFSGSEPGEAHRALAELERRGLVAHLITQNVDGLHHAAGSRNVIELHGRLALVKCLACGAAVPRSAFQEQLDAMNPDWRDAEAELRPDGDAALTRTDEHRFRVPACGRCADVMKPDVVFFGERVPPERVTLASRAVAEADALLVIGSSLMVYSGLRFVRQASEAGLPIGAVNMGRTRADELLHFKVEAPCGPTLARLAAAVGA